MKIQDSVLNAYKRIPYKRISGAEMTPPSSFDEDSMTATFVSRSTGEIYNTSLKSCTCVDFSIHHRPCKHMVRTAILAGIPITYTCEITIPVEVNYGEPVPEKFEDLKPLLPDVRDYSVSEFFSMLDAFGIAHADNRESGGCIWVENQKQFMEALSKLTVEGKKLRRKYYGSHFSWNFDWYLMTEVKKNG